MSISPARRVTFHDVFTVPEFRALWASYILSAAGDRLALVALTLFVYDRTRSPLLAAIAFAAGTLPYVIGALFLSAMADRFPRREVMVTCDVIRAVLVGAMLLPRMPLVALIVLLYAVTSVQPPFDAARSAILRDVVEGERYALAVAVLQTTFRVMIVAGTAAGGVVVAFLGARPALGVDAATFVVSAVLLRVGVRARPAAAASGSRSSRNALLQLGAGARVVFGDRALRTLVLFGWLAAFYEIPAGLAAPYAARLGGGPVAAGLLIAGSQLGAAVATPLFTKRIGPLTRLRWMGPMATCTCGVLLLIALRPGLVVSIAILALSSAFGMYQIAANTAFVERLPNERRAQAFGLASAGLVMGQGLAFLVAGAAAEVVPPSTVIALGGGLGAVAACGLSVRWRDMSPAVGRHSARHLGRQASPVGPQSPVAVPRASLSGQSPVHAARSR
ncbi:MAG TPA: MFS transporter [Trebonia sp.]